MRPQLFDDARAIAVVLELFTAAAGRSNPPFTSRV